MHDFQIKPEYLAFAKEAEQLFGSKNVHTTPLKRLSYGTDGSYFRLIPQVVVDIFNEHNMREIVKLADRMNVALTFRAGGTSLSGQSAGEGVLVRIKDYDKTEILEDGKAIKLQVSIIGDTANSKLAHLHRQIGPDPATLNTAHIGGMVNNNSSGMCCGTKDNSYQTLRSMRIIFNDGYLLDTGDAESIERFKRDKKEMVAQIEAIRKDIISDTELTERIKHKYAIKNTTGYGINSFVDFTDPVKVIEHLIIGSEGTLACISEVTLNTVVNYQVKGCLLPVFKTIKEAAEFVGDISNVGVSAAELIDYTSMKMMQGKPGVPEFINDIEPGNCAILVDVKGNTREEAEVILKKVEEAGKKYTIVAGGQVTFDPVEYAALWKVRKGLFTISSLARENGTTTIIEDIAFPYGKLAEGVADLRQILDNNGYTQGVIFGHAMASNVHFSFSQSFASQSDIARYDKMIKEVCDMVVNKHGGSLKAEHGTGRAMAAFVEMEWGKKAYEIMKKVKNIFDPKNIFNPDVIICNDPNIHLKNLKALIPSSDMIDKCIECGFCEPTCPTRNFTLTPRQRITAFRAINNPEFAHMRDQFIKEYQFLGIDTCAADGMCGIRCPVLIDTGKFIKDQRHRQLHGFGYGLGKFTSHYFGFSLVVMSTALTVCDTIRRKIGTEAFMAVTEFGRLMSFNIVPHWLPTMPTGRQDKLPTGSLHPVGDGSRKVVYFPSCVVRGSGHAEAAPSARHLTYETIELLEKAGYTVIIPRNLNNICCGQPYESKGMVEEADHMLRRYEEFMLEATDNGKYPILMDTSPCLYRVKKNMQVELDIYGPVEFAMKFLLPHLDFEKVYHNVAVHVTCSTIKMGLTDNILNIARMCSDKVVHPEKIFCCAFAGDKGFEYPEMNATSLRFLHDQVYECEAGFSTSETCEIGLSKNSGIHYRSIIYLLNAASKPKAAVHS